MSRTRTRCFLLLVSLIVIIPGAASAQTAAHSWTAGFTAGVTMSKLSTDDDVDLDGIWGGVGGLFATRSLNRNVGLQIEALVSQRGAKSGATGTTLRLTYLDVPVLLRFGSTTTNDTHVHAFAGLAPGFKINDDLSDGAGQLTSDITGKVKGFDLGLPIGVAVENGPWSVDARYTLGLVNVNDSGADIKNRAATFKVGYRFR